MMFSGNRRSMAVVTGETARWRSQDLTAIDAISGAVQPPTPINTSSMGLLPLLEPPASGGPSIRTSWPESAVAEK